MIISLNSVPVVTDKDSVLFVCNYLKSDFCKQSIVASNLIAIHGSKRFIETMNYLHQKQVSPVDLNNFFNTSVRAHFAYEQQCFITAYLENYPCLAEQLKNTKHPNLSIDNETVWANIAEKAFFEIMNEIYIFARLLANNNIVINLVEFSD